MIRLISLPLAVFLGLLTYVLASMAFAHDHERPALTPWFKSLVSRKGPCCDGSDALHLTNVDWETKDGHYRVRVPSTGQGFERAMNGEKVEMDWVDVPEEAVLEQPNLDGETLVWPMYGYMGKTIRCFMPGTLS